MRGLASLPPTAIDRMGLSEFFVLRAAHSRLFFFSQSAPLLFLSFCCQAYRQSHRVSLPHSKVCMCVLPRSSPALHFFVL